MDTHLADWRLMLEHVRRIEREMVVCADHFRELQKKGTLLETLHVEVRSGLIQLRAEFDVLFVSLRAEMEHLSSVVGDHVDDHAAHVTHIIVTRPDKGETMKDQVKTLHFWLTMLAISIGTFLQLGYVDTNANIGKACIGLLMVLTVGGVAAAAKYLPPRVREILADTITIPAPTAVVVTPPITVQESTKP